MELKISKTATEGRNEAMTAMRQVKTLFEREHPYLTGRVDDDPDVEGVQLFLENENDEPVYASTVVVVQNYDGSVAIDVQGHHSVQGLDFPDGLSPQQIYQKAEAYIKRNSDVLKKATEVQAFENALLAERVATRFAGPLK